MNVKQALIATLKYLFFVLFLFALVALLYVAREWSR